MKRIKKMITILLCSIIVIGTVVDNNHSSCSTIIFASTIEESGLSHVKKSVTDVNDYTSDEMIIRFKDNLSEKNKNSVIASFQQSFEYITDNFCLIRFDNRENLKNAIPLLITNKNVEYIQPNYTYDSKETDQNSFDTKDIELTNDKYSSFQWALNNTGEVLFEEDKTKPIAGIDINIKEAWNLVKTKQTKKVTVALVDTGVDYNHVDLKDHMWINSKEIANNLIDDDGNGFIDDVHGWNFYDNINQVYSDTYFDKSSEMYYDDHGTHCAGIIAATSNNYIGIAGIASYVDVQILPVKALGGPSGSTKLTGSTTTISRAIKYAEKMGAQICNLSLGASYEFDEMLYETIKNSKMLFVIAAGNGDSEGIGYNTDKYAVYPASYDLDNIISVANLRYDGKLEESSNYGIKSVDLAAPGTLILSTRVEGKYVNEYGRYIYLTGTSMATPMVTGVAALLYSYYDNITVSQAKNAILQSVKKLDTLEGKVLTGGMLDASASMTYNFHAPIIKVKEETIKNSNHKILNIQITDSDNNVTITKYSLGTNNASYFRKGTYGNDLKRVNNIAKIKVDATNVYTIYAIDKDGNETIKHVKVTILQPQKIQLSSVKRTLKVGKSYQIRTTIFPKNVVSKLYYKSSNTKVATVDKNGKVTAKKVGTATITVRTSNEKKAMCKIIVK